MYLTLLFKNLQATALCVFQKPTSNVQTQNPTTRPWTARLDELLNVVIKLMN